MTDPSRFVRLVVDPIRLALLGAAAVEDIDSAAIASALGTDERRVRRELGKLIEAGLVVDGALNHEAIRDVARALPKLAPAAPELVAGPWTDEEARVLSTFFSGRRLTEIPTAHGKRRLVLERLAMEFEPGMRYEEREVNFTLQLFHSDYAALRRYMVDEGFLTRAEGVYWRTGGRYDDDGAED
jgi:hypothetical protein